MNEIEEIRSRLNSVTKSKKINAMLETFASVNLAGPNQVEMDKEFEFILEKYEPESYDFMCRFNAILRVDEHKTISGIVDDLKNSSCTINEMVQLAKVIKILF